VTITETPAIDADHRAAALHQVAKHWPQHDPARAVDAALAWLTDPARDSYPGDEADAGWHGLILASTSRYAELCERLAGRFIHHEATGATCRDCQGCRHDPCENPAVEVRLQHPDQHDDQDDDDE
jgi:hypothetical protein